VYNPTIIQIHRFILHAARISAYALEYIHTYMQSLPYINRESRLRDDVTIDYLSSTENRILLGVLIFEIRYVGVEDYVLLLRGTKM
jgi:hypothetical protein